MVCDCIQHNTESQDMTAHDKYEKKQLRRSQELPTKAS